MSKFPNPASSILILNFTRFRSFQGVKGMSFKLPQHLFRVMGLVRRRVQGS